MIWFLVAAAAVQPDCEKLNGAIAQDQCRLAESMALDPPPNCKDQLTQFDMNVCSYRDYLQTDLDLNRSWEAASHKARADSSEFNRLSSAQRKWIAYRDAQCLLEAGPREGSGTIWALVQNSCMQRLAKARVAELRQYVEPEN